MKLKIIAFSIAFLYIGILSAQSIEITPSYGIQFGSKLNYGVNYLKISDGDQYGVNVGYEVDYGTLVEASWIHHDAELSIKDIYIAPTERKVAD